MKLFIKSQPDHLPDSPTVVSRWELPWEDRLALEAALANFDATGNAVFALRAFALTTKLGVYPPQRILQWVSRAFQSWLDEQGEMSMDKAMHLAVGRGKTPVYEASLLQDRNQELMWEMDLLIALGAKQSQAAAMIESRLDKEDWNKSRHELGDIKFKRLITLHAAQQVSYWDAEQIVELEEDPDWHEWVRARLRRYNALTIPPTLKARL